MHPDSPVQTATGSRTLEINKVLKNTYLLLSMTLLFSAVTAWFGMSFSPALGITGLVIWLVGTYGLLFLVHKNADNGLGVVLTFAFTGWLGFWLGPLLMYYISAGSGQIIMQALAGTAITFFALSGYVLTTKKDFSFARGFIFTGMITVILASVIYAFAAVGFGVQISGFSLAISALCVFIFSAAILLQTSDVIHGVETNYIRAAIGLYISIYNIFTSLLHLLSAFDD